MRTTYIRTYMIVVALMAAACAYGAQATATATGKVNVNSATAAQLMLLPGVGPKTADAIIAARPYKDVTDLERAKGIGPKKLEALRAYVVVTGPTTLTVKVKSAARGSRKP